MLLHTQRKTGQDSLARLFKSSPVTEAPNYFGVSVYKQKRSIGLLTFHLSPGFLSRGLTVQEANDPMMELVSV
jgi:hypothetical protein